MDTYEKKYNEALERARKLQETCDSQAVIGWCEYLFPELKESEDERVRKAILELVRQSSEVLDKQNQNNMIAWLEKQGEKPINYTNEEIVEAVKNTSVLDLVEAEIEEVNGEDYGINGLYHAQRILEKTLGEVDGYQTDDGILEHKAAITAVKKLYKQKPTWGEEDEEKFRDKNRPVEQGAPVQSMRDHYTNCLKSLKQKIGG